MIPFPNIFERLISIDGEDPLIWGYVGGGRFGRESKRVLRRFRSCESLRLEAATLCRNCT